MPDCVVKPEGEEMMNAKELELKLSDALQREDVLKQQLAVSQREFRAADATIENMQMELEKMAAENAALKSVVSEINNELYGQGFMVSGWHQNGALESLDNWFTDNGWGESETPETDAFLAEVRAQGADECMRKLVTSDDDDFSDAPNICAMVAHQLRKGVQS